MATYKVLQDIEAEDKLVGPLSLRQFIYAGIVLFSAFIAFKLGQIAWYLVIPFLPHMILFGVLASPFGHDQPSEIWLLAKIRFYLKPRRRIWDQSGMKELVTITVPKKIERQLTDNLSQREVRSRLNALANTLDSRGWAVKNVNVNLYATPSYALAQVGSSDRLIDMADAPREVPEVDIYAADDVLDERNNPTAQHLTQMIDESTRTHRQQLIAMTQAKSSTTQSPPTNSPQDYWFLNPPTQSASAPSGLAVMAAPTPIIPNSEPTTSAAPTADEQELAQKLRTERDNARPALGHMRTLQPMGQQAPVQNVPEQNTDVKPMKATSDPAIMNLANNNDLNVETIARQANKTSQQELSRDAPNNEVVISLR